MVKVEGRVDTPKLPRIGKIVFPDGSVYDGQVAHRSARLNWRHSSYQVYVFVSVQLSGDPPVPHGLGRVDFAAGAFKTYDGRWSKNSFHGEGVLGYRNGDRYEGEFKQVAHRAPRCRAPLPGPLTGVHWCSFAPRFARARQQAKSGPPIAQGKRDGKGRQTNADGTLIEGTWKGDLILYNDKNDEAWYSRRPAPDLAERDSPAAPSALRIDTRAFWSETHRHASLHHSRARPASALALWRETTRDVTLTHSVAAVPLDLHIRPIRPPPPLN